MVAPSLNPQITSFSQGHSFFDTHKQHLEELFGALGRQYEWADRPEELLPYTQTKWVGKEHGSSVEKDHFTPVQEAKALQILCHMGLKEPVLPPVESYDQIVIIGGLMRVNRERLSFVKQLIDNKHVSSDHITFWAGQRPRDRREDDQLAAVDTTHVETDDWAREELSKSHEPGWDSRFATESELARLAYLERFPTAKLIGSTIAEPTPIKDVPDRQNASHTFVTEDYPVFTLMNCVAVERPMGLPRHTTASCAEEWLESLPVAPEASVLLVAGNPHAERNLREVRQVASTQDREDIDFTVAGPAANPDASLQLYLGEIGRLIYMDTQASKL